MSPCFPRHLFRLAETVIHVKFVSACPGVRAWYVSNASAEIQGSRGRISVDYAAILARYLCHLWEPGEVSAVREGRDFVVLAAIFTPGTGKCRA